MRVTQNYRSFLLRLWRSSQDPSEPWQASLECPQTGKRWGFARLSALYAFLDALGEEQSTGPPFSPREKTPPVDLQAEQ